MLEKACFNEPSSLMTKLELCHSFFSYVIFITNHKMLGETRQICGSHGTDTEAVTARTHWHASSTHHFYLFQRTKEELIKKAVIPRALATLTRVDLNTEPGAEQLQELRYSVTRRDIMLMPLV